MFTFSRASASAAALAMTLTLPACGGGHHHGNPGGPGPGPASGPTYDVIPIGLPGITYGEVTRRGIANGGIVAGTSRGADGTGHAFLYDGSKTIPLGTLGGDFSQALAVNPCGHVTGWSETNAGTAHAFLYDGKRLNDLGSLGGNSFGNGLNNLGVVVGYSFGPCNAWYHAFLYDSRTGGPLVDLGSPVGNSVAVDINDAGQVTGWFRNGEGPTGAFLYELGKIRDIGTLGGASAEAVQINGAGLVIGTSATADGSIRGFVYDGTTMTNIGSLPGGNISIAEAINGSGLVVGAATTATEEHAVSWTRRDGIVDLNDRLVTPPAGLVLVRALAVADDGYIALRTNLGLALLRPRK